MAYMNFDDDPSTLHQMMLNEMSKENNTLEEKVKNLEKEIEKLKEILLKTK